MGGGWGGRERRHGEAQGQRQRKGLRARTAALRVLAGGRRKSSKVTIDPLSLFTARLPVCRQQEILAARLIKADEEERGRRKQRRRRAGRRQEVSDGRTAETRGGRRRRLFIGGRLVLPSSSLDSKFYSKKIEMFANTKSFSIKVYNQFLLSFKQHCLHLR